MRILHTADWHLGHQLRDLPREYEHDCFLRWLLGTLAQHRVDVLLIAGDVFDGANPPASAQAAFFEFLADARRELPDLAIVVIGGNHDSASRLDAPASLLRTLGVHVVGALPRDGRGRIDFDRVIVPLRERGGGQIRFVAIPFLRPADLGPADDGVGSGVGKVYAEVLDEARTRTGPGDAIVAMGHCYMMGGSVSEASERRILGGNQHALPGAIFPSDIAYAALGHLHLAQAVNPGGTVRYSGSPIPLSMTERGYKHEVALVDIDAGRLASVRTLQIPRAVGMIRIPDGAPAPLTDVLLEIAAKLPTADLTPLERRPFLEVHVRLDRPQPTLARDIAEAVQGKAVRLLQIHPHYPGAGRALAQAQAGPDLHSLLPEDVFKRRYRQVHDVDPPSELLASFQELVDVARQRVAS